MTAEVFELTLPPALSSARAARRLVRKALAAWGMPLLADTAVLLTTEVVTNSVLHARTTIHLRITREPAGGVTIAVRDRSTHLPRRRAHAADSTTGRGLELLDALASSWRVDHDAGGKTLVFAVGGDP